MNLSICCNDNLFDHPFPSVWEWENNGGLFLFVLRVIPPPQDYIPSQTLFEEMPQKGAVPDGSAFMWVAGWAVIDTSHYLNSNSPSKQLFSAYKLY